MSGLEAPYKSKRKKSDKEENGDLLPLEFAEEKSGEDKNGVTPLKLTPNGLRREYQSGGEKLENMQDKKLRTREVPEESAAIHKAKIVSQPDTVKQDDQLKKHDAISEIEKEEHRKSLALPRAPFVPSTKDTTTRETEQQGQEQQNQPVKLTARKEEKTEQQGQEQQNQPVKLTARKEEDAKAKIIPLAKPKVDSKTGKSISPVMKGEEKSEKDAAPDTTGNGNEKKSYKKESASPSAIRNESSRPKSASLNSISSGRVVARISTPYTSSGQILQEARVRNGYSLHQVEQITKIKKGYIEALENDNYDDLPHYVFVKAYVKHLCELYKLRDEDTKIIFEHIKQNTSEHPISEEILQHIEEEKQINEQEETKIKWILGIVAFFLISILVAICIYGYIFISKLIKKETGLAKITQTVTYPHPGSKKEKLQTIRESDMEQFVVKPDMDITELPVPEPENK